MFRPSGSAVRDAYNALAPAYDLLTRGYRYDRWLIALEQLAVKHGLTGHRLLDVACGTGESFLPLKARGYRVTACDVSEEMLAIARLKAPEVTLHCRDMRELPTLGRFDLVTCVDDALNYVTEAREVLATLQGFARNLAPGGIAVWDLNTLSQFRGQFARDRVISGDGMFIGWHAAKPNSSIDAAGLADVAIDVFAQKRDGTWERRSSVHRQRHWSRATIERLTKRSGLELLEVRGQRPKVQIDDELDELTHTKAIYLARWNGKEDGVAIGEP